MQEKSNEENGHASSFRHGAAIVNTGSVNGYERHVVIDIDLLIRSYTFLCVCRMILSTSLRDGREYFI